MDDHVGACTRNQDVTLFSISLNNCGLFKHDYRNRRLTPGFTFVLISLIRTIGLVITNADSQLYTKYKMLIVLTGYKKFNVL